MVRIATSTPTQVVRQQQQQRFKTQRRKRLLLLLPCAVFITIVVFHQSLTYQNNHLTLYQAPIHYVSRPCPTPTYPLLLQQQSQQSQQSEHYQSRICLTSLTDQSQRNWWQQVIRARNFDEAAQLAFPNQHTYATQHGYTWLDASQHLDNTRPPSWSKIRAVQAAFQYHSPDDSTTCDWVLWLDADVVIMNMTVQIESFLPATHDLILTDEKNEKYNAGAWLIRKSEWSRSFLQRWWNMTEYVKPKGLAVSGDNDALNAFLSSMKKKKTTAATNNGDDEFTQHVAIAPRCTFNSVACWTTSAADASTPAENYEWYGHEWKFHRGDFVAHVAGQHNKIDTLKSLLKNVIH